MSAERRLRAKRLEEELEADLDLADIDELMGDGGDDGAGGDGDEVDIDGACDSRWCASRNLFVPFLIRRRFMCLVAWFLLPQS